MARLSPRIQEFHKTVVFALMFMCLTSFVFFQEMTDMLEHRIKASRSLLNQYEDYSLSDRNVNHDAGNVQVRGDMRRVLLDETSLTTETDSTSHVTRSRGLVLMKSGAEVVSRNSGHAKGIRTNVTNKTGNVYVESGPKFKGQASINDLQQRIVKLSEKLLESNDKPQIQMKASNKDTSLQASNKGTNLQASNIDTNLHASNKGANLTMVFPSEINSNKVLIDYVKRVNQEQVILNEPINGIQMSGNRLVVVVQVHDRPQYLTLLIKSLRKVGNIHNVLLIFSHDWVSRQVNALIQSITFCPVMQIFFPYSSQLYPGLRVLGDKRHQFTLNKVTQPKHHWFWKVNHVFDHLRVTSAYSGPVVFIEEDFYMAPDFVDVARKMYELRASSCPECGFFALSSGNTKTFTFKATLADKVFISPDMPSMGFMFDRAQWGLLRACAKDFCTINEYNWDWSLHRIVSGCTHKPLRTMVLGAPRVFHLGLCGMHVKNAQCDPSSKLKQIERILEMNSRAMFPTGMSISGSRAVTRTRRMPKLFEGWDDPRDHAICLTYLKPDAHG